MKESYCVVGNAQEQRTSYDQLLCHQQLKSVSTAAASTPAGWPKDGQRKVAWAF